MILRDFVDAIADLSLVLALTLLLLAVLLFGGWWLKRRALKLHIKANRIANHVNHPASEEQNAKLGYAASFWQGISTELFGAVLTSLAFGVVVVVVQQVQSIQNHKTELILRLGSPDNTLAVEALRELTALEWLYDGTLQSASLQEANFQNVNLDCADLQGANLLLANMKGARLVGSNLQNAVLYSADLRDAYFTYTFDLADRNLRCEDLTDMRVLSTNLQGALLSTANLRGANLSYVKLQGAVMVNTYLHDTTFRDANLQDANLFLARLLRTNLTGADLRRVNFTQADLRWANLTNAALQGADLKWTAFITTTILPDGSRWTPNTDMSRFTDPNHPDFWQPAWVTDQSP